MNESITELPGYSLIVESVLRLGERDQLRKVAEKTNTSAGYEAVHDDEVVGRVDLDYHLKQQYVSFDISISRQGQGLGISVLRQLATLLDSHKFELRTGGVNTGSRSYWEHLADRGDVTRVEPENPNTQYRVLPIQR